MFLRLKSQCSFLYDSFSQIFFNLRERNKNNFEALTECCQLFIWQKKEKKKHQKAINLPSNVAILVQEKILTTQPLEKNTSVIKFIQLNKLSFMKTSLHCPYFSHFCSGEDRGSNHDQSSASRPQVLQPNRPSARCCRRCQAKRESAFGGIQTCTEWRELSVPTGQLACTASDEEVGSFTNSCHFCCLEYLS